MKKFKVKSNGLQTFNVPNTPEGLAFIESLRKYSHKRIRIRQMGRATDRKAKYATVKPRTITVKGQPLTYTPRENPSSLLLELSDWIAVYIHRQPTAAERDQSRADRIALLKASNEKHSQSIDAANKALVQSAFEQRNGPSLHEQHGPAAIGVLQGMMGGQLGKLPIPNRFEQLAGTQGNTVIFRDKLTDKRLEVGLCDAFGVRKALEAFFGPIATLVVETRMEVRVGEV